MRALDPQVELVPAEFQAPFAECFHMYFTGVGGARVHAKLLRPKNASAPHPAVLMFHGYSGNSGDWNDKLGYVARGCTVAALDCRGQGGLSEDVGDVTGNTHRGHIIRGMNDALNGHPEKLLFRQIFLDTAQMAKIVMEMPDVDAGRVGATGGSQGGALTVACVALEPRVQRAAPIFPFLSDYQRVWNMDQAKDAYQELKDYFRLFDPSPRARGGDLHEPGLRGYPVPGPAHQGRDALGHRPDGHHLPAVEPVRRVQQDHRAQDAGDLSRLRAREPAGDAGQDLPVHAGVVGRAKAPGTFAKCPAPVPDSCSLTPYAPW